MSKAAGSITTFDFLTLYNKIPHDKVLHVLNETVDFACKGRIRDSANTFKSGAFWSRSKSKTQRSYSLQERKLCSDYLINNSFSQLCSKIFCQVIAISFGLDSGPFFADFFFVLLRI